MPRNDKLYEESRIIRKAANEGRTTIEIMQTLSLTAAQIRYRVETRYTDAIARKIIKQLEGNDKGVYVEEETEHTEELKQSSSTDNQLNNAIVVDTSALKCKGAFQFIMNYKNVILLVDIVKQMNNHKNDEGIFGENIRKLLKESAKDQEGIKIKVTTAGKDGDSAISKLLAYCKDKNVVLYTADDGLATIARYFKIKYILAKDIEDTEFNSVAEVSKEVLTDGAVNKISNEEAEQIDLDALKRQMQLNSMDTKQTVIPKVTISNVFLLGKLLTLIIPRTDRIKYVVISGGNVKYPISSIIHLEKGEEVIIAVYKKDIEALSVSKYEITDILEEKHALYLGTKRVKEVNQIESLDLPREAKRELKNYFSLIKK